MKAFALHQPWASLVALGAKKIETRHYPPEKIGLRAGQEIAIHATKRKADLWRCDYTFFSDFLKGQAEQLPLGALVATCTLVRASEITEESAERLLELSPHEYVFGNYLPGRWAWVLGDVKKLQNPVPAVGRQGTFEVNL